MIDNTHDACFANIGFHKLTHAHTLSSQLHSDSISSQSTIDELEGLSLYTLGGNCKGLRSISYNMFMSASGRSCLAIPPVASIVNDAIAGECAPGSSFRVVLTVINHGR